MKYKYLILLGFLASCSYVPERIDVAYHPTRQVEKIASASGVNVRVQVLDNRRDGKQVSRKKDDGIERASINLSNDIAEEIAWGIKTELVAKGFTIADGDAEVIVEIQKFYNDFKEGLFGSRGVSELILNVTVGRDDGYIRYSKTIIGIGENNNAWTHSGNNARRSLERALGDAIHKIFNDRAFIQALTRRL